MPFITYPTTCDTDVLSVSLLKRIAEDWCETEDGEKQLTANCGVFNWDDFSDIPDWFLARYGVKDVTCDLGICSTVDCSDLLVVRD